MSSMQNPTGSENTGRSQSCPTPSSNPASTSTTSTGATSSTTGTSTGTTGTKDASTQSASSSSTGTMQSNYQEQLSHLTGGTQEKGQGFQEQASEAAQQVKEKAYEAMDAGRQKAAEVTNRLKNRSRDALNEQKGRLANQLHRYSEIFHDSANRFRNEKDPNIAEYADMIADGIDCATDYIKQKDINTILRDTERTVYYRPAWFLGGMFLAGIALARFLKASRTQRFEPQKRWSDQGYYGMGSEEEPYVSSTYRESYASGSDYGFEERRRQPVSHHTPERRVSGQAGFTSAGMSNPTYRSGASGERSYTTPSREDYRSGSSMGTPSSETKTGYGSSPGSQTSGTGTANYGSSQKQSETTLHPTGSGSRQTGSSSQQASGGTQSSGLGNVKTPKTGNTHDTTEDDTKKANADSSKSKEYDL